MPLNINITMAQICADQGFDIDSEIQFGNGIIVGSWLLDIGFNVNKACVFDLYATKVGQAQPLADFYFVKSCELTTLSSVVETQTAFNFFKLVCKTDGVVATISYALS